jgi:glutamyl-tRNA reductase
VKILALGVDHRSAPTSIREALAFEGERLRRGLDALKDDAPDAEFVLLSTCNRVELYAAAESDPPDGEALAGFLARFHDVPVATLDGHLVARRDEAAVGHLFRVAAGLESLVTGEGQVLGQVRDAYKLASECKAVGCPSARKMDDRSRRLSWDRLVVNSSAPASASVACSRSARAPTRN